MRIRRFLGGAGWAVGMGATFALVAMPAVSASAGVSLPQTLGGTATLTTSSGTALTGTEDAEQNFTIALTSTTSGPAACSGDTASDGTVIDSYLIPAGVSVTSQSFSSGAPADGFAIPNVDGTFYTNKNTSPTTAQIQGIPLNLDFGALVNQGILNDASPLYDNANGNGVWNAGIACVDGLTGQVTDYWNTVVTFVEQDSESPDGFVWSAVPGVQASTPEVSWAATLPVAGVAVLGSGLWFSRRRRSNRKTALVA